MNVQVAAGLLAAARSAAYTAAGVIATFLTLAATTQVTVNGVTTSGIGDPAHLWAFAQISWFPFLLGQVVPPLLRGGHAFNAASPSKGP